MDLYNVIPENLFSPLASKNKSLYVKGLFVLLDAFKQQLKILKDELTSMMAAKLENELLYADFSEEELFKNEQTLSEKHISLCESSGKLDGFCLRRGQILRNMSPFQATAIK